MHAYTDRHTQSEHKMTASVLVLVVIPSTI